MADDDNRRALPILWTTTEGRTITFAQTSLPGDLRRFRKNKSIGAEMLKQGHIHVDELLIITPPKCANIGTIKSKLGHSELVQSIVSVSVAHVDNIAKRAIILFDPKALLQLLSGNDYNTKKEKKVVSLTDEFRVAEEALVSAFKHSKEARATIKETNAYLADVTRRGQAALKKSRAECP